MKIISAESEYRQSLNALEKLLSIYNDVINIKRDVHIDITNTTFISPAYVPILFSLPEANKHVFIRYNTQNERMFRRLNELGILEYYNVTRRQRHKKDISFKKIQESKSALETTANILDLAPIRASKGAVALLQSKLYEIFDNSLFHGKSDIGTFTNGHYDKNRKQLIISIYDYGVGITKNVNDFLRPSTLLNDRDALQWALTSGNSTKKTDYPSGLGLTALESFIYANDGMMTLCSGNARCVMQERKRKFSVLKQPMMGTLFIMNIKADNEHEYVLSYELGV